MDPLYGKSAVHKRKAVLGFGDAMQTEDRTCEQYFHEVSGTQMPHNAEEERLLFERYLAYQDVKARNRLVEGGLRFVIKIARQYAHGDTEFLKTLIQAGNIGLLIAVDRYRPWVIRCRHCGCQRYVATPQGQRCDNCNRTLVAEDAQHYTTRFLTYAAWWVSEAIRAELYSASMVYVPPYKQKVHHRERQAGHDAGFVYVPYDTGDDRDCAVASVENEATITNDDARQLIYAQLGSLPDRQAFVLVAYFGLREDAKTLREISQRLGVSSERVRQIKTKALEELRSRLERRQLRTADDAVAN
jgi:RNA polymerase sigma factor (sigma-70 family)